VRQRGGQQTQRGEQGRHQDRAEPIARTFTDRVVERFPRVEAAANRGYD
jgi:hypothetical protein